MNRVAVFLVSYWLMQGAICLLPGLAAAAHASHAESIALSDSHGAPDPEAASHGHHGPTPPSPANEDACELHCASLSQAISPDALQAPARGSPVLELLSDASTLRQWRVDGSAATQPHRERPPPDLLLEKSSLRL